MVRMTLVRGDITTQEVDAIVNAANEQLVGGGGVDGAIHAAGGPGIMAECDIIRQKQGGCPPGEAVLTGGGNLPARCVIHTVGPIWHGGDKGEAATLERAYLSCLHLAEVCGAHSIAFPNISTGVYGFPKEAAARIALKVLQRGLQNHPTLERVLLVCHDAENYSLYQSLMGGESLEIGAQV